MTLSRPITHIDYFAGPSGEQIIKNKNLKIIVILLFILFVPVFASSQTKQYYLYNIVTFEGNFDKEGIKVKVDDGKTVDKLKDDNGNRIKFKTPAAALMYFFSKGWDMYLTGDTSSGSSYSGTGSSYTTSYWILRKPCTKEEFDKTVKEGVKK